MKLTVRSEYALLALLELARQPGGTFVTAQSIAQAQDIPLRFLEQILLALRRAGVVRSLKGQRGGYCLARPAEAISLAHVIRLLDGAIAPTGCVSQYFYHATPLEQEQGLVEVFRAIRDHAARTLEGTTLADVLERGGSRGKAAPESGRATAAATRRDDPSPPRGQ